MGAVSNILKAVGTVGGGVLGGFPVKLAIYAGIILFAVGSIFTLIKIHDDGIRTKATVEALGEFNRQQFAQNKADTQKFEQQLGEIKDTQTKILSKQEATNASIHAKASTVRYYLNSPEAKASDRPSSEILKGTIKRLGNQ